jgi:hypothetical protein
MWKMYKVDKIFVAAIVISLFWHFFWMFGVKVIIAPKNSGTVKFSRISFLGPILDRGALEVRMGANERSLPEKRYLAMIGSLAPVLADQVEIPAAVDIVETDIHAAMASGLTSALKEALSASKLEPDYKIE